MRRCSRNVAIGSIMLGSARLIPKVWGLKADKKAIFTAASKASEAAAFLAAFQGA